MTANSREERQYKQKKLDDQRKEFQIDRDRIIYSAAFRRLAQVTQVASASEGNVFHNRLTHSLKVAQVGRRLAEKLIQDASTSSPELIEECGGLNPDVVEAAALSHDLGHPPFGHIAEKELNQLARIHGLSDGFEGNAQTFRILTRLEPHRSEYPGLNLTRATLNATLKYPWFCHRDSGDTKTRKRAKKYSVYDLDRKSFEFVRQPSGSEDSIEEQTLEASIMDFADDVTYSVHDLEDFYLAGLIPLRAITREEPEFGKLIDEWLNKLPNNNFKEQIKTIEEQNRLKNLLEAYIPPRYTPGSIEQIA
jgi:dGTPase